MKDHAENSLVAYGISDNNSQKIVIWDFNSGNQIKHIDTQLLNPLLESYFNKLYVIPYLKDTLYLLDENSQTLNHLFNFLIW